MDAKLDKLGAKRFFERGEGDDDSALEEDFNKWKKRMWPTLCKTMGLDANDVSKTEDEKLYHILITLFLLLFLLFESFGLFIFSFDVKKRSKIQAC